MARRPAAALLRPARQRIGLAFARWSDVALGKVAIGVIALLVGVLVGGLSLAGLLWLVALFAALGILGYGVNDWSDRTADTIAGKGNVFTNVTVATASGFFALATIAVVVLTVLSPRPASIAAIVALQVALAVAYSLAPLRLKACGAWGLGAVILAQYTVPSWIILTSIPAATRADWIYLNAFALVDGLVLEIGHQRYDRARDLAGGVHTFAARRPLESVAALHHACVLTLGVLIAVCPIYIASRLAWENGLRQIIVLLPLVALTLLQAALVLRGQRHARLDPYYGEESPAVWRLYSYLPNCFIPLYLAVVIAAQVTRGWLVLAGTILWLGGLAAGRETYSTSRRHYGLEWHLAQIRSLLDPRA